MIIEKHKLIGPMPVKRRVQKVTKIEPVKNGAYMNDSNCPYKVEPKTYDTVLAYCQSCGKRIDIPVVHNKAANNQYQLVSVPIILSDKLDNYRVECIHCGSKNIIEKQNKIANYEVFTIKLDCSNIHCGTDSWYKNDSSSSGDGHPRKF
jgi:DNA-directed RNA polymerase subunit RPC12/RpoP